jgi:hypothetical protein
MNVRSIFVAMFLAGVAAGCATRGSAVHSGRVVVYEARQTGLGAPMTVFLKGPYGILVRGDAASPYPDRQRYELFSMDRGKIATTCNKQEFQKLLSRLPSGSKVDYYDVCTFGLAANRHARDDVLRYCTELGIAGKFYLMCICFGAVEERDWKHAEGSQPKGPSAP